MRPISFQKPDSLAKGESGFFIGSKRRDMATASEMLTAVETAISARLSGGAAQSYTIDGRNIQYISLSELREFRDQLRKEVNAGRGNVRTYVTFKRPT